MAMRRRALEGSHRLQRPQAHQYRRRSWLYTESASTRLPMHKIREIGATEPTPLSLQQMKVFADGGPRLRLVSAAFLHKELQLRFSRCVALVGE